MEKNNKPLIIFDFDGTICDSYLEFIIVLNTIAKKYRLNEIKDNEVEELRRLGSRGAMRKIGISFFKLPFVLRRLRKEYASRIPALKPIDGMEAALAEFRSTKLSMGILTSNSVKNTRTFLEKHNLNFFDFIYSGNSVFGKDKRLKKIISHSGLSPSKDIIVYIGDETRDIAAAQKVGIISIAVTWGYNSREALGNTKPDYLIDEPEKLTSVIRKFTSPSMK